MTSTTTERITITNSTIEQAKATPVEHGASLMLRLPDGRQIDLPTPVETALLQALTAIATTGSVTIGQVPDELTSTVAAEMLGVTRPTLIKWAREGVIDSFQVGTHTRFHRDEVLRLKQERAAARRAAFEELRALDMEHDEFLDD
ncbi:excisionase family DNA binding protein [Luteococcus japonicus]|uniref:Possible excisionase n=2 Tax=Luteococcus japonicus TaxID=33984 RepID=A0A1R4J937_9ACTN|nr:helix-turn-helix domain-containing protein [Luteococcus japonicus]ROR54869.1 excisionase family DNA binding protein [Luteococcus japonicus]SJN28588.1 possible excisionase [Luteococcus japonicus LSP_Lj1]